MIFSAEDDYFHLRRQRAFEALRQGYSAETATDDHDSSNILRHDVLSTI